MIKLLKQVLSIQTVTYNSFRMFAFIIRFAAKNNIDYFVVDGSIYLQKGNILSGFPCIISHIDTVHELTDNLTVMQTDNGILFGYDSINCTPTGIGGDDKVGVFIALQMLLTVDNLKCVFFRDEETGCEGSNNVYKPFFDNVNFALQFDRKGNNEFVTNAAGVELSGKAFQQNIKQLVKDAGYTFYKHGGLTDVCELKSQGIDIAMANICAGYYAPHTENEYVIVKDVVKAFKLCLVICTKITTKQVHKVENKSYNSYYGYTSKQYKLDGVNGMPIDSYYSNVENKNIKAELYSECECCSNLTTKITKFDNWKLCNSCVENWNAVW